MKPERHPPDTDWSKFVGETVEKFSGKPFKSGKIQGKVVSLTKNPHSGKDAFLMDDGSIVDSFQCNIVSRTA